MASMSLTAPALAVVPHNGWGFGIADPSETSGGLHELTEPFVDLGPKTFRHMIPWHAAHDPARINEARTVINHVKARGVEQIIVTFRKPYPGDPPLPAAPCNDWQPSGNCYSTYVSQAVQALADKVDVWGPANEPNAGDTWLVGDEGAGKLVGYMNALANARVAYDPSSKQLSPEFHDRSNLGSISGYVNAYKAAGGSFGDYIGWHPYWGVHHRTNLSTQDLLTLTPSNRQVWVTEVGAQLHKLGGSESEQAHRVHWLINGQGISPTLASLPRVERILYYHMKQNANPDDSGLVRADGTVRPSWFLWCMAAHADSACWSPWTGLGGDTSIDVLTSAPAVASRAPGNLDVFARGADNALYHKWLIDTGWYVGWHWLGGSLASAPAAVSWGPNRIDVFARGSDNGLWHKFWDGAWHGWGSLGGTLTSAPTVGSRESGHLDVYARGSNNQLIHWWFDGTWHGPESLGGTLTSKPAVVWWNRDRADIFARGTDNSLVHIWWDGAWHPWEGLGGSLTSNPTVTSWEAGRLDVFATDSTNALVHKWFAAGSWHDWQSLGGPVLSKSDPDAATWDAVSWDKGRIDLFVRGTDDLIYQRGYDEQP